MAPQVVIRPLTNKVKEKMKRLKNIFINGKNIRYYVTSTGDIRLEIKIENVDKIEIQEKGANISPIELGVEKINIQDASKAFAYHIPQGVLLHYNPSLSNSIQKSKKWNQISVLDVAPSLIKDFNKDVPSYMKGDDKLFTK